MGRGGGSAPGGGHVGPALLPSLLSEKEKGRRMGGKKAFRSITKGSGVRLQKTKKSLALCFAVCLWQQSLLSC